MAKDRDEPKPSPPPEGLENATLDRRLETADLPAFEAWLQTRAAELAFSLASTSIQDQTDLYLETEDWRFYRASYVLRMRQLASAGGVVAQLRRLDEAAGGPSSPEPRCEVSEQLADDKLETLRGASGPVGQRARALAGVTAIRPLFAMQTRRKSVSVAHASGLAVEVGMDETCILRGPGQEPARLQQVRVTGSGPAAVAMAALIDEGCRQGVLQRAERSTYAVGLEVLALTPVPAPEFGPTDITDTLSFGEMALAVLRRHFAALLAHEPGARLGDDPEGVHRMRVATRRLRAALSLFANGLPRRPTGLRDELRWVAAGLGEVRDLDVQLERVAAWQAEGSLGEPGVLDPLKAVLEGQRTRARSRLLGMLDTRRYAHLVQAFSTLLESRAPRRLRQPIARRPAVKGMPALIVDRYHQLRQAGDDLTEVSPPQAYHGLRIRGKRLRYALEFVTGLYGEAADELARSVVALQDLLGLLQDAMVAMAQLRALLDRHGRRLPPPTVFAMGEIAQRYAHQVTNCVQRFPDVYRQVQGKPWKRLRQAMKARGRPKTPGRAG